ncbi:leucine-rich repeat-containing protein 14B-like [Montipora capricornis]|uniref:leucine-rich repeat-containing protein 14B-like n=1 Tax=Montipora capricornis TaxID=246305 RepID=UPI0035F132A5
MASTSLMKLSVSAIIHQHGSFLEEKNITALPRNLLQELLLASIFESRILFLRSLITNWPLEQIVLRNVAGFDEPKAILLAYSLQRVSNNLILVDMRGCKIGAQGTTAFCKLAVNLPISDDVSGMVIEHMHPAPESGQQNTTKEFPCKRVPPIVILIDGVFLNANCVIAVHACKTHSIVDLKISHASIIGDIGTDDLASLLNCLEPEFTTGLDLALNELAFEPRFKAVSQAILPLNNLTELNLSYNNFCYRESKSTKMEPIIHLANICSNFVKLKKIDLSGNYIKAGASIILHSLNSSLTHLNLAGCGLKGDTLIEMSSMENLAHLQYLNLSGNGLARKVCQLSKFILQSAATLEFLSLEENSFVTSHVAPLCQIIKQLPFLKKLSLCYNDLLPNDVATFRENFPTVEIVYKDLLYLKYA